MPIKPPASTAKYLVLGLSASALASCRLVISTEEGGSIGSGSGLYDCDQPVCAYEISAEVTESFTALPAPGYRFVRWRGLCTTSPTAVCETRVFPLPDKFREHDGDIGLSAEFEPDDTPRRWYRDRDGDHYGSVNQSRTSTAQPQGFVANDLDCNDYDPEVRPWAREREDGKDNNCNDRIDEGFVEETYYRDSDGDGFGDPAVSQLALRKPRGFTRNKLDCDDRSADDHPEAAERLDGRDNNCNGEIDEGGNSYFQDLDGDGYGADASAMLSLTRPEGYAARGGDCDDGNPGISPGAEEILDSVDNNCDGLVDEGFILQTFYRDADGDGYGDREASINAEQRPPGYVGNGSDNCVNSYNPDQADSDGDGLGDACDSSDERGGCNLSAEAQSMLDAVNDFRARGRNCGSEGDFPAAPPLSWSCELATAALDHSRDMADNDFFGHTGSDGSSPGDRARQVGYAWHSWGENIAAGHASVSSVMQGWIDSPGHCANLMRAHYRHLGSARYFSDSSRYGNYWTQVFGSR